MSRARMPRLIDLAPGSRVSDNAKSIMLTELKRAGFIPDDIKTSHRAIDAEKAAIASTVTPYGPLMIERAFRVGEDEFETLPVQNPLGMLTVAMSSSERFSNDVRTAIERHGVPSAQSPWGLVVYFDEIMCGSPLAQGPKRKVQGVYWTFYELGMEALSDGSAWFEVAAFRQELVCTFVGEMSYLVEQMLLLFSTANLIGSNHFRTKS